MTGLLPNHDSLERKSGQGPDRKLSMPCESSSPINQGYLIIAPSSGTVDLTFRVHRIRSIVD